MKVNNHTIKPGANLRGADLRWANLGGANLNRADLRWANLNRADLRGANLGGANLAYAYLRCADLRDADLLGATLAHCKGIQAFVLGGHFGFAFKYHGRVYVKIGCECHTLNHWLKNVNKIGKSNKYSDEKIRHYKIQLKAIKEMYT